MAGKCEVMAADKSMRELIRVLGWQKPPLMWLVSSRTILSHPSDTWKPSDWYLGICWLNFIVITWEPTANHLLITLDGSSSWVPVIRAFTMGFFVLNLPAFCLVDQIPTSLSCQWMLPHTGLKLNLTHMFSFLTFYVALMCCWSILYLWGTFKPEILVYRFLMKIKVR